MKIDFTPDEARLMRELLEIALKAVGRDAVPAFVAFDARFALAQETVDK